MPLFFYHFLNYSCHDVKIDKMAEQDKQVDSDKTTRRSDILRAKDIIPGRGPAKEGEGAGADIPQFNLADDIMAEQRRQTASRRKGPASEDRGQKTDDRRPSAAESQLGQRTEANQSVLRPQSSVLRSASYTSSWDPIIADIVARDIERLCEAR